MFGADQNQLTGVDTLFSTTLAFAALKRDGTVVTWGHPTNGGNSSAVQADLVQVRAGAHFVDLLTKE